MLADSKCKKRYVLWKYGSRAVFTDKIGLFFLFYGFDYFLSVLYKDLNYVVDGYSSVKLRIFSLHYWNKQASLGHHIVWTFPGLTNFPAILEFFMQMTDKLLKVLAWIFFVLKESRLSGILSISDHFCYVFISQWNQWNQWNFILYAINQWFINFFIVIHLFVVINF